MLGIPISLGSVQHLWEEAGEAVKAPCQELEEQLPKQAVLNIDGSGWRNNAKRRTIVVLVAAQFVCYRIVESQNWETVLSWLGATFAGVCAASIASIDACIPD